jgi:predicted ester cyclase
MTGQNNNLEFNKSLVRRFLEEAVSTANLDLFDEICGPDYVWHGEAGPTEKNEVRGLDNFKEAVAEFTKALPDLKVEIQDMIAEGDKVAVRFTERGTHTGAPFAGISPSGKRVVWTCIGIYRVANGKLVEEWFNEDSLAIMKQLGAL